jgi:hypothetical protein
MAQCAYCGAETRLYSFGTPICLECVDARKKGSDPQRNPRQSEPANPKADTPSRSESADN